MIIKRNLKSQMPSLKRSKLGDSAGEDDDNSAVSRKKRKTNTKNGYYPLNLLGEVAAGIIPVSFRGILSSEKGFAASWCTELSCSPGEVESKTKGRDSMRAKAKSDRAVAAAEVPRPPLVRTSRGRVQVLPSRLLRIGGKTARLACVIIVLMRMLNAKKINLALERQKPV